ncbi:hypothetical protein L1283_004648 [Sphingobacterium sp. HSC-15S19]
MPYQLIENGLFYVILISKQSNDHGKSKTRKQ